MPKKLNLIGERFGRLVVIKDAPNKGTKTRWECKCDCGKTYIAQTVSLRSGRTKSCGCLRTETARKNGSTQIRDLTNQRFGLLTVLGYAGSSRGRSCWKCQCDCGKEKIVNSMELLHGDTLSCGCLRSSYGENIIEKILQKLELNYEKEYSFSDLTSNNNILLRFDFAVFNQDNTLQCLIEYDGEQHYLSKADKIWSDTLENRQKRDKLKNDYAISHKIPLYRIPYWDKNVIKTDTLFLDKYLIK